MIIPLRGDWPGMRADGRRVEHHSADVAHVARVLRGFADKSRVMDPGTPDSIWRDAQHYSPGHAPRKWTAAEMVGELQWRSVSNAAAVLEAFPRNLCATAQRLDNVSRRYFIAEEEIQAEIKRASLRSRIDSRGRRGTSSGWSQRSDRGIEPLADRLTTIPLALPLQGAVAFTVDNVPDQAAQPSVKVIASWLRELQREAAWEAQWRLADEWHSLAGRLVPPLRHFLCSVAGELELAWYDRAAPLGQQALRRIDGTAHVLENFARMLVPRTVSVARSLDRVARLDLGGRQRSEDGRILTVFLDLDESFRNFLITHPRELAYDLPFGGDLPGDQGVPLIWPAVPTLQADTAADQPSDAVAPPVIGGPPPPAPPPKNFWLPPDDASPGVIG